MLSHFADPVEFFHFECRVIGMGSVKDECSEGCLGVSDTSFGEENQMNNASDSGISSGDGSPKLSEEIMSLAEGLRHLDLNSLISIW